MKVFTTEHFLTMGLAGGGAVTAAFIQTSQIGSQIGGPNVRDVLLLVGAVFLAAQDGQMMRAFGIGIGAVAVGSLIRNNVLTAI